ncbi:MAG: alpha/beta hydrolase family protein [Chitinophagales bacterium]
MIRTGICLLFACFMFRFSEAQRISPADTLIIHSGNLELKALLFKPPGHGPYPAILFAHGSHSIKDSLQDVTREIAALGSIFARRGWIFLGLCRRGVGLSSGQGISGGDIMNRAFNENGQDARNRTQLDIMEGAEYDDLLSGLSFLLQLQDADHHRIALVGHSFGASLGLIFASKNNNLKAAVLFSPGGYSWDLSSPLRNRLIKAGQEISIPSMVIHAENDYSTRPGFVLDSLMNALNKTHLLKIYPQFGDSASEGHALIYNGVEIWETDLFNFLDKYVLH